MRQQDPISEDHESIESGVSVIGVFVVASDAHVDVASVGDELLLLK